MSEGPPNSKASGCESEAQNAANDTDNYTHTDKEVNGSRELPPILTMRQSFASPAIERPEIIKGILRQNCKMALGGGAKARKTWQLINLAICIATGEVWLERFETNKTKVLYINFELHRDTFDRRVAEIAEAMEVETKQFDEMLSQWPLRGYAAGYKEILPKVIDRIRNERFGVVIIDPMYKILGGADENSSRDMTDLMNQFEAICFEAGAGLIFAGHYGKGNKSSSQDGDRIRGSSALIGDVDAQLEFVDQADSDKTHSVLVVKSTLREFQPVEDFTIEWDGRALFSLSDKDPEKLKKAKPGAPKLDHSPFLLEVLGEQQLIKATWLREANAENSRRGQSQITQPTFYREVKEMLARKLIQCEDGACFAWKGFKNA